MKRTLSRPWHRLKRSPGIRFCRTYLSQRFTAAGRAILLIWLVVGIPSCVSFDVPLDHIWSGASAILAVSWLLARLAVPNIRLTRRLVQPVMAGNTLTIEVDIENHSRRTAYGLSVGEIDLPNGITRPNDTDAPIIKRLDPGARAVLPIQINCATRGIYPLSGPYAASAFPLGVCRGIRLARQPASLVVYPAYTVPPEFSLSTQYHSSAGDLTQGAQPGGSTEFVYTRDYRAGDNPRHLHWTAWARTGIPAIKVYRDEDDKHVGVILDTDAAIPKKETAFEAAISAVAGIGAALTQDGWTLRSLIAGGKVYPLATGVTSRPLQPLLTTLARLHPTAPTNWHHVTTALTLETQPPHAVVAVLLDWSSESATLVNRLEQHQITSRILVVRDGPTSSQAPILPPPSDYQHLTPGELWPQPLNLEPVTI